MRLVVAESEFGDAVGRLVSSSNELNALGMRYVACMRGITQLGYHSDLSGESVERRCERVEVAVSSFHQAVSPLSNVVNTYIQDVASIDKSI